MKAAVIGRGFGSYAMKPAFEGRGWEVELIPSRDLKAVAAACDGSFDLIAVHSPPFQHREHVLRAIEAGKHVLCDKPFGKDAHEAREMRDAARAAGILHFLNYEFRCSPGNMKVRELLQAGAIGALHHINYYGFMHNLRHRKHGWLNEAGLGGGWLGARGSHLIDGIRWFCDSEVDDCGGMSRLDVPLREDAQGNEVAGTAEDACAFWMTLENGATASVDIVSAAAVSLPERMHFIGSEGTIELFAENVVSVYKPEADPEIFDLTPPGGNAFFTAIDAWVGQLEEALKAGTQIAPSFDDGAAAAHVMDMLKMRFVRP
jgi:predicted dehydrogenase